MRKEERSAQGAAILLQSIRNSNYTHSAGSVKRKQRSEGSISTNEWATALGQTPTSEVQVGGSLPETCLVSPGALWSNYWHCFAGGGGEPVIDFWMKWEGCDFTTAVRELAETVL